MQILAAHGLVTTALVAGAIWCTVPRAIPLQITMWVRRGSPTQEPSVTDTDTTDIGSMVPNCEQDESDTLVLIDTNG